MHCDACIRRVTRALNQGEEIKIVEVRLGAARLSSHTEPAAVDRAIAALAKAGYTAHLEA
jgi:copper chaperone